MSDSAVMEATRADLGTIFRLAYVSEASVVFQPHDLRDIAEKSGPKNEKADITGILVMDAGKILQILEGEEGRVLDLFRRIAMDPRHQGVRQVAGSHHGRRLLNCWSMVSGQGGREPAGIIGEFHALHDHLTKSEKMVEVASHEVDLLKTISLLRSVPL